MKLKLNLSKLFIGVLLLSVCVSSGAIETKIKDPVFRDYLTQIKTYGAVMFGTKADKQTGSIKPSTRAFNSEMLSGANQFTMGAQWFC